MLCLSSRLTSRDDLRAEVLANRVGAQRQRQAGRFEPPLAGVDDERQSAIGIGELPFVNDQAGVDLLAVDTRPVSTTSMISSNGTTTCLKSMPRHSRSAR